jgi:hypothetical protein
MSRLKKVLIGFPHKPAIPSSRIRHNVDTNIDSDGTRDCVETCVMRWLTQAKGDKGSKGNTLKTRSLTIH